MFNFIGKSAIITGSGRGIGRAIAKQFADSDAFVVVSDIDAASGKDTVRMIKENGGQALFFEADVSRLEEVEQLIQTTLKEFGRIDILVNNAGITRDNLLIRMSDSEWNEVISTNLTGVYNGIKSVSRIMMKQKWGRIINITSVSAIIGNIGQCNYAAAKAGIIGLSRSAARELAARGITVNAVAPGFIETEMTAEIPRKTVEYFLGNIPVKRMGQPEDVATTVLFLATDQASYITGQVVHVNGGLLMA
jgi:3-oxoacyl-[acyl-carrier protein] reductase